MLSLQEKVFLQRAKADIAVRRALDFDEKTGLYVYGEWEDKEEVWNVKTTVGIDFLHTQSYSTGPLGNGLNYIALSNDALTETTASTTLSNEIAANGLSRAIGAFAHTPGLTTSTISKTFTCATGAQAAQKSALFNLSSAGVMAHALAFTQRSLQIGDQLQVQYTITLT